MNVAILHYHLKRGGVSSVVLAQALSLSKMPEIQRIAIIAGSPPDRAVPFQVIVAPGMNYDISSTQGDRSPDQILKSGLSLANEIEQSIARAFPDGCDIVHVHNPLIRKNGNLLGALGELRRRGFRLLLQIHDFAEDFRPDVFDATCEYPANCDYATINNRDRHNLIAAGLDPAHVHLLPNSVSGMVPFDPRSTFRAEAMKNRRTILYPVRAIRRKNLGETLLVSRFLPDGAEIAVTLPPTNPRDLGTYELWKRMAHDGEYTIRFEAGASESLDNLYESAFRVITTSVKEGFGFSYLDPLMRGIPVMGREIPSVVGDFRAQGIELPGLYDTISLPMKFIPRDELSHTVRKRIESLRHAFSPLFGDTDTLERILTDLTGHFSGDFVDFGALDEHLQGGILEALRGHPSMKEELMEINPVLGAMFETNPDEADSKRWKDAIGSYYSERLDGKRLLEAYRITETGTAQGRINKALLAERFLLPRAFFLSAS